MKQPCSPGPRARVPAFLGLLVLLALSAPASSFAHDDDLGLGGGRGGPFDGTWRLVAPRLGPGEEEFKTIGDGRFTWYVVRDGRILQSAAGRASVRAGRYEERIDCVQTEDYAWMVGAVGTFEAERDRHTWHHRGRVVGNGRDIPVDETWERVR